MSTPDGGRWNAPIYVYAIVPVRSGVDETLGGDAAADRLGTIATGPFAAVVSNSPQVQSHGRSREELVSQLLVHQKAIERIMLATPLLPVKFGTVASDEAGVRVILEAGKPAFEAAFDRLDGCVQMEILVRWDLKEIFAEIATEDAVIRLKGQLERAGASPDQAARAEFGRLVKEALERRRTALAAPLVEAMRAVAMDMIVYPSTADQVVVHLVLLMKESARGRLDHCLATLDTAYGGQLAFRCVGPSAPYSFATVEVEVVDAASLARARQLLGIAADASAADVRAAYYRLAKGIHPDLAVSTTDGSSAMAALTEAYRLLAQNAEADKPCRQSEIVPAGLPASVGSAVHVVVRRQPDAVDVTS